MSDSKKYYCATCTEMIMYRHGYPLAKHRNSPACIAARNSKMAVVPLSLPSGLIPSRIVINYPTNYKLIMGDCERIQQSAVDNPNSLILQESSRYSSYLQVICQGFHLDFSMSERLREFGGSKFDGKRIIHSKSGCFAEACLHSVSSLILLLFSLSVIYDSFFPYLLVLSRHSGRSGELVCLN